MLAATQTTLYIQYNKDHAYSPVRTQKGQRSQTVSTALSVAIITRQPYIMKAISVAAPIYDIWNMGGVKLNIRFTIIPFLMGISTYTYPNLRQNYNKSLIYANFLQEKNIFFKKKSNKARGTIKNGGCLVCKVTKTASFELVMNSDDKSIVNRGEVTCESNELIIGKRLQEGDNSLQNELF